MTNIEFLAKLQTVVKNYKTVYMLGCFGAPVTKKLISGKAKQLPSWYTTQKQADLKKLINKGYFAFDCVNLIKGILWGWTGDSSKTYGGAVYKSNEVPDTNANGMIAKCLSISTDLGYIEVGETVWMPGHIGVYIGNGKVIECTPKWANSVQVTNLKDRGWVKHGKLPYIVYEKVEPLKYSKIRRYNSYVHIVEMDPATYRLDITEGIPGKLEKLSAMYGEPRLNEITWVRMNAQFFGGSSRGYGAYIDPTDNLSDKPSAPGYTDLTYKGGRLQVGTGGEFTIGTSYGLIAAGKTNYMYSEWHKSLMAARHPRSMAGSQKNGNNVFVVTDGRWTNLSLGITAQQQTALGHELGCMDLVNFDGGGSSQLMISDEIKNRPSDGRERAIISAIMAYRKYTLLMLPVLKKGSKGVYANLLQRLLNNAGYNCGAADGIFGNSTLAAVKKYQKQHGLVVDGIVGKMTWTALTDRFF